MIQLFIRGFIEKNKTLILNEARQINGFMKLLMKQRNTGIKWTKGEKDQLKIHLWHLSAYVPVLTIFILPFGSLLIPILAEIVDRRKTRRILSMEEFLKPTYFIDSDNPEIIETARELTRQCKDEREKAVTLFLFVRDRISYNPYGPIFEKERYRASKTLKRGYGYCIQKATLLAALLRAIAIPAALIFADIKNPLIPKNLKDALQTDEFIFHCYNNIFIKDKWVKATCAFDSGICERLSVPTVEFNGEEDAIFPPYLPDGRRFVTYLRQRGICSDVPFDDVIKEFRLFYGEEVLKATSYYNQS